MKVESLYLHDQTKIYRGGGGGGGGELFYGVFSYDFRGHSY